MPPSFDQRAKQLHVTATAQLSPRTLARLRAARHAAAHGQTPGARSFTPRWLATGAFSLALLAVFGVGLLRQPTPSSSTQVATQTDTLDAAALDLDALTGDPYVELDANPDLFVWLGSDSQPLAME